MMNVPFSFSIQSSSQFCEEEASEEMLLAVLWGQVEHAGNLGVLEAGAGARVLQKCKWQFYQYLKLGLKDCG